MRSDAMHSCFLLEPASWLTIACPEMVNIEGPRAEEHGFPLFYQPGLGATLQTNHLLETCIRYEVITAYLVLVHIGVAAKPDSCLQLSGRSGRLGILSEPYDQVVQSGTSDSKLGGLGYLR
jgi:hypothetical protein